RDVAVVREITKMFEEVKRGYVEDLVRDYQETGAPKGEIVLVIASSDDADEGPDDESVYAMLRDALETMEVKEAAKFVAEKTGRKKTDLYDMALSINKEQK
ncbi:MAG: 16S rRNA (cytidine(1402)-2'-O)-methyltransferase, partial [Alphaproteobacteria bacterium]|nr:16S rRNA (cytidine(1402)-2'-O)-methyltransferase [Alphaproteobacteria bacterium]